MTIQEQRKNITAQEYQNEFKTLLKKQLKHRFSHIHLRKSLDDEDVQFIRMCMDDPQSSMIDILVALEQAQSLMDPKDYIQLRLKAHRQMFGDTIHINQRSINVNMNLNEEEVTELLEQLQSN